MLHCDVNVAEGSFQGQVRVDRMMPGAKPLIDRADGFMHRTYED
jgi:hypothetical protein